MRWALEDDVPYFDLPLEQLRTYRPDLAEPDDLDSFWQTTLAEARTHDLDATFEPVDTGLAVIETFDVAFSGFGGDRIRGWFHRPVATATPMPAVVEFLGYGGGRGLPHEKTLYARPATPTSSWTPAARGRAGPSAIRPIRADRVRHPTRAS